MIVLSVYCELGGELFSPRLFSEATLITLKSKTEPGELIKGGKYDKLPSPGGVGVIDIEDKYKRGFNGEIKWLSKLLNDNVHMFQKFNVQYVNVYITIECEGQCNWELDPETMKKFGNSGANLLISIINMNTTIK